MDKRIIAVIAVLAVALAAVPMIYMEDSDAATLTEPTDKTPTYYKGVCGSSTATGLAEWKYTLSSKDLEITKEGTINAFSTWTLTDAFNKSDENITSYITKPTCSNTVKGFSLKVGSSLTATIGTAFKGVSELVKIDGLGKATSIADDAYNGCAYLTSVKADSVTTIGKNAFNGCSKLESISFSSATKIGESAFSSCKALKTTSITKVTEIGASAFKSCESLVSFALPSGVIAIANSTFSGCKALKEFTSVAGLKTIGVSAFEGCENLSKVVLTSSNAFESIGDSAFKGCKALVTLNLAATTKAIGGSAFENCVLLESVSLGKVTDLDHSAFKGCVKLKTLTVDTANTKYLSENNVIYVKSGNNKTELYMAANALSDVVKELPSTITKIHLDYSNRVYILDAGKSNVTTESHGGATSTVFLHYTQGVKELSSIGVFSGTFTMKYSLYSGWNPNNMTIGGTKVEPTKDGDYYTASYKYTSGKSYEVLPVGVKNLTLEDLQKADKVEGWIIKTDPKVDVVEGVITNITSFTCVILGYEGTSTSPTLKKVYTVEGLDCTVTNVTAEKGWKNMKSLTIDGDVPVSSGAFTNVQTLESLTVKGMTKVSDSMFRYCTKLKTVTMDGCKTVGAYAFEGCTSLMSVDLGTVESVDSTSFSMCMEITAFKVDSKSTLKSGDVFIVRCDNSDVYFKRSGNLLEIHGATKYSSFSVVPATTGAETVSCTIYNGGIGVLDITGYDSITLAGTTGSNNSKCLVVFDTMGGSKVDSQEVAVNGMPVNVGTPTRDGYTFMGWYSYPTFDPTGVNPPIEVEKQKVTMTTVYYAHWASAESSQDLHIYVIIGVVVAVVASVAMLVYHRLR